jgi:DUF1009 family protein
MSKELGIIAGKGAYPIELAESARAQGVGRIVAVAFRGETSRLIERVADEVRWVYVGQLAPFLDAFRHFGVSEAVMAGQITPSNLFLTRIDKPMRALLSRLPRRNADTIFGAIGEELAAVGVCLAEASRYMESRMPVAGILTSRAPGEEELADIRQGLELARASARLQAGQSVVIKRGTVIAVEAFEGTDRMIRRAGKVGGRDGTVVKVAREGHDMRFDIPVVGLRTLASMRRARCRCLALEAGRAIVLEREKVVAEANRLGIAIAVVGPEA